MNEFFRLSVMMNLCLCVGLPSGHNSVCFCETLSNLKDVMYGFFFWWNSSSPSVVDEWEQEVGRRPPHLPSVRLYPVTMAAMLLKVDL